MGAARPSASPRPPALSPRAAARAGRGRRSRVLGPRAGRRSHPGAGKRSPPIGGKPQLCLLLSELPRARAEVGGAGQCLAPAPLAAFRFLEEARRLEEELF